MFTTSLYPFLAPEDFGIPSPEDIAFGEAKQSLGDDAIDRLVDEEFKEYDEEQGRNEPSSEAPEDQQGETDQKEDKPNEEEKLTFADHPRFKQLLEKVGTLTEENEALRTSVQVAKDNPALTALLTGKEPPEVAPKGEADPVEKKETDVDDDDAWLDSRVKSAVEAAIKPILDHTQEERRQVEANAADAVIKALQEQYEDFQGYEDPRLPQITERLSRGYPMEDAVALVLGTPKTKKAEVKKADTQVHDLKGRKPAPESKTLDARKKAVANAEKYKRAMQDGGPLPSRLAESQEDAFDDIFDKLAEDFVGE